MIATSTTKLSSLGGAIAKQAAAVRQRTTSYRKQYYHHGLATITGNKNFVVKNVRDNNDDDEQMRVENHLSFFPIHQTIRSQPLSVVSESRRVYHTTPSHERAPAIMMGLATISALGFAGSSAIKSYNEWKNFQPTKEELDEIRKQEEKEQTKMKAQEKQKPKDEDDSEKPRTNIFREWFDVGTKYYEGGFEETMTRREAALILGVRESSSSARVKDAHRRLLMLNHPDAGGSTYMAGKLNEAKELLLKGKSQR